MAKSITSLNFGIFFLPGFLGTVLLLYVYRTLGVLIKLSSEYSLVHGCQGAINSWLVKGIFHSSSFLIQ